MQIVSILLELTGGLAMFMYGMQLASDGIQRAAGDRLQKALNFMTANRVVAVITGAVLTVVIQSSSATSVMVVSFVNAGLLSLVQAIGVIMGANIGTTLTGWIIALVGVQKFSIAALAVPVFGLGFFMSITKKRGDAFRSYGFAFMGFAMIFLGLSFISKAIPKPSGDVLLFLEDVSSRGFLSVVIAVLAGLVFTVLINASSATLAIVIALSAEGIIDFRMAAAITLGANIGTTLDAFLASFGSNVNGKRAAWAHIIFNVIGTLWVLAIYAPFLRLVDFLVPGEYGASSAGAHIAMFHTIFNTANTIVLLPFVRRYADLLLRLFKDKEPGEKATREPIRYVAGPIMDSPELNLLYAQKEISNMAGLARSMFIRFREILKSPPEEFCVEIEAFAQMEDRADQMREELSRFILECGSREISDRARRDLSASLRIVDDLENMTDDSLSLLHLLDRGKKRLQTTSSLQLEELGPYTLLVENFLGFVVENMNKHISEEQLSQAAEYENKIDELRSTLKKNARKRLKAGSDVKLELMYIDIVRHIEKIGDHAYGVAHALREMR